MELVRLRQRYREFISNNEVVVAVALVVMAFAFIYYFNLDGWLINDDEGSFLYQAWRVSEGDVPYRDFLTSHWPFFLYSGGAWVRIWGASVLALRGLAAGLMLATSILVFALARSVMSERAALLSMVVFLFHQQIYAFGRFYQPEPFYVFMSTLALLLFVKGQQEKRPIYVAGAGGIFALATMYKPLAVLPLGGCVLALVLIGIQRPTERLELLNSTLVLTFTYALLLGGLLLVIWLVVPTFFDRVFGMQFVQGRESALGTIIIKNVDFLLDFAVFQAPLILVSAPAIWAGWKGDKRAVWFAAQLPTALAFLIFSRDLFMRLLLYLIPSLTVLMLLGLEPLRRLKIRGYYHSLIVALVVFPWLRMDIAVLKSVDSATPAVVEYLDSRLFEGDVLLSDYQELNFYTRTPSTYSGAEISTVFTDGGVLTAKSLIDEAEEQSVDMVVVDVAGDHLASLQEYDRFRMYLHDRYELVTTLSRNGQQLEVHVRKGGE